MKGYLRISPVLAGVMMATGAVGAAGAQCVTTQDCKALGYTEASCSGGKGVKCPFGNGWYCGHDEVTPEQCSELGFSYSCSGTGYAGGVGSACGGKFAQCTCSEGYEWKSGNCQKVINGASGDLYYCGGKVVGVKTGDMDFYVAMEDLGTMTWSSANSSCQNYSFCGNLKGTLPSVCQVLTMYNNKFLLESLLLKNGGAKFVESFYRVSTGYSTYGHYIVDMSDAAVEGGYYDDKYYYVRPVLVNY